MEKGVFFLVKKGLHLRNISLSSTNLIENNFIKMVFSPQNYKLLCCIKVVVINQDKRVQRIESPIFFLFPFESIVILNM